MSDLTKEFLEILEQIQKDDYTNDARFRELMRNRIIEDPAFDDVSKTDPNLNIKITKSILKSLWHNNENDKASEFVKLLCQNIVDND